MEELTSRASSACARASLASTRMCYQAVTSRTVRFAKLSHATRHAAYQLQTTNRCVLNARRLHRRVRCKSKLHCDFSSLANALGPLLFQNGSSVYISPRRFHRRHSRMSRPLFPQETHIPTRNRCFHSLWYVRPLLPMYKLLSVLFQPLLSQLRRAEHPHRGVVSHSHRCHHLRCDFTRLKFSMHSRSSFLMAGLYHELHSP